MTVPHLGLAYTGLMADLRTVPEEPEPPKFDADGDALPDIDDALYLKKEHEFIPGVGRKSDLPVDERFDDNLPQKCYFCEPLPNENNEDYSFYLCGTSMSLELSESVRPPAPPTEPEEREGIVDAMTYRNTVNTKFPFTRGFYDAVTG